MILPISFSSVSHPPTVRPYHPLLHHRRCFLYERLYFAALSDTTPPLSVGSSKSCLPQSRRQSSYRHFHSDKSEFSPYSQLSAHSFSSSRPAARFILNISYPSLRCNRFRRLHRNEKQLWKATPHTPPQFYGVLLITYLDFEMSASSARIS